MCWNRLCTFRGVTKFTCLETSAFVDVLAKEPVLSFPCHRQICTGSDSVKRVSSRSSSFLLFSSYLIETCPKSKQSSWRKTKSIDRRNRKEEKKKPNECVARTYASIVGWQLASQRQRDWATRFLRIVRIGGETAANAILKKCTRHCYICAWAKMRPLCLVD